MSMCYWMCEGIGIRTSDLEDKISKDKFITFLKEQFPNDYLDLLPSGDKVNIEDYSYGEPFENLGDILCHCDDTCTLDYGDNGNGEHYFYYTPSYPWNRRENEPKTIEEVKDRIVKSVQKLCDLSDEEIRKLIDEDIYEYGCG